MAVGEHLENHSWFHCSFSGLFKLFILLAVIVIGTVFYHGGYSVSTWTYKSDISDVMTRPNKSKTWTRLSVSSVVQRLTAGQQYELHPPIQQELAEDDWLKEHMKANRKFTETETFKPKQLIRDHITTVQPKATYSTSPFPQTNTSLSGVGIKCDQSCSWWRKQDIRQRRVQDMCSDIKHKPISPVVEFNLSPGTLQSLSHLLVLDSHKLIYCYIPKVSCTNWKRIFLVAKGIIPSAKDIEQRMTHIQTNKHFRTLSSYSINEAKLILKKYRTFMFVRHPFERLVSAYIDKFEMDYPSSTLFRREFGPRVVRYGTNSKTTPRMKDGTLNVTFQQFVRFVSDPNNRILEPHWSEMYSLCQPCMIHYDILSNYSTLIEDADFIIKTAKLNQEFPASTNPTGSSEKMHRYFAQLTSSEIKSLYKRYSIDFRLFGYSIPKSMV